MQVAFLYDLITMNELTEVMSKRLRYGSSSSFEFSELNSGMQYVRF